MTTSSNKAAATFEKKVPFADNGSRLHHSKALQPKQQLLGQAIGLLQELDDTNAHTLSYLTDIFAICVMYHVEGKVCVFIESCNRQQGALLASAVNVLQSQ